MKAKLSILSGKIKNLAIKNYRKFITHVDEYPLKSFLIVLSIFIGLIVLSNFLRKVENKTDTNVSTAKEVTLYSIGETAKVRFQGKVDTKSTITIIAQNGGVVQKIGFTEGQKIKKSAVLVSLSTTYAGGNVFSAQRQLAGIQYKNARETYPLQKDIVAKQREVADKANASAQDLQDITRKSLDDTKSLISLNDEIIATLDKNNSQYAASNSAGVNDSQILSTKQIKSQFQAANNQLKSALLANEYQVNKDTEPVQITNTQKDIALKQLDVQEKLLDLNIEMARLQYAIAQLTESTMYPQAPFDGVVERVHVRIGQAVAPGTPLVTITAITQNVSSAIVVYVPAEIAGKISQIEDSIIHFSEKKYAAVPRYISSQPVQDGLYAVYYDVAEGIATADASYISVEIPLGSPDSIASIPFIPIDTVYQSQDKAFVFIAQKGRAKSKQVQLGQVYGRYVAVMKGLTKGDKIIENRTVIEGDKVHAQ